MSVQPLLTFDDVQRCAPSPAENPLRAEWQRFHRENPEVWAMFVRFTLEALAAIKRQRAQPAAGATGAARIGARMVWERMRWECSVGAVSQPFRLNDHLVPYYARHFVETHAEGRQRDDDGKLAPVFELRGEQGPVIQQEPPRAPQKWDDL